MPFIITLTVKPNTGASDPQFEAKLIVENDSVTVLSVDSIELNLALAAHQHSTLEIFQSSEQHFFSLEVLPGMVELMWQANVTMRSEIKKAVTKQLSALWSQVTLKTDEEDGFTFIQGESDFILLYGDDPKPLFEGLVVEIARFRTLEND